MHTYTYTPVAILALSEKLKDLCLVASGIEESKVGFVVVSTMENSNGKQSEDVPVLEEPEVVEMSWARFGRRFEKRSGQRSGMRVEKYRLAAFGQLFVHVYFQVMAHNNLQSLPARKNTIVFKINSKQISIFCEFI